MDLIKTDERFQIIIEYPTIYLCNHNNKSPMDDGGNQAVGPQSSIPCRTERDRWAGNLDLLASFVSGAIQIRSSASHFLGQYELFSLVDLGSFSLLYDEAMARTFGRTIAVKGTLSDAPKR